MQPMQDVGLHKMCRGANTKAYTYDMSNMKYLGMPQASAPLHGLSSRNLWTNLWTAIQLLAASNGHARRPTPNRHVRTRRLVQAQRKAPPPNKPQLMAPSSARPGNSSQAGVQLVQRGGGNQA